MADLSLDSRKMLYAEGIESGKNFEIGRIIVAEDQLITLEVIRG